MKKEISIGSVVEVFGLYLYVSVQGRFEYC